MKKLFLTSVGKKLEQYFVDQFIVFSYGLKNPTDENIFLNPLGCFYQLGKFRILFYKKIHLFFQQIRKPNR